MKFQGRAYIRTYIVCRTPTVSMKKNSCFFQLEIHQRAFTKPATEDIGGAHPYMIEKPTVVVFFFCFMLEKEVWDAHSLMNMKRWQLPHEGRQQPAQY